MEDNYERDFIAFHEWPVRWLISLRMRRIAPSVLIGWYVLAYRYLLRLLGLAALVLFPTIAFATSEFELQCHKLLPSADAFYERCQKDAVPFGRTFYPSGGNRGEEEYYRVLFDDNSGNSHFILGCAIANANVKMVSIYYKTSIEPLPPLREEYIQYADLQGHIGLNINGQRRILLAVRQIVTEKIPARYNWGVTNCGISDLEGSAPNANSPKFLRDGRHRPNGFCSGLDVPCRNRPYVTLFGDGLNDTIFMPERGVFVDGNGTLIVPQARYEDACQNWLNDIYGPTAIILEGCKKRD
ncbi:hypothetical protein [Rhizobium esperanzae]|uniref:Uncharacterized protein n=1 Tax=Rhizobium esperanzae TaxID=1967781 RepID=A0A7W6R3U6_9HYPH|nr:hypothetical protein [Rhizobium esperanzae]MBB4236169.1 hypothetical protein [Rhizobium esperanzae]